LTYISLTGLRCSLSRLDVVVHRLVSHCCFGRVSSVGCSSFTVWSRCFVCVSCRLVVSFVFLVVLVAGFSCFLFLLYPSNVHLTISCLVLAGGIISSLTFLSSQNPLPPSCSVTRTTFSRAVGLNLSFFSASLLFYLLSFSLFSPCTPWLFLNLFLLSLLTSQCFPHRTALATMGVVVVTVTKENSGARLKRIGSMHGMGADNSCHSYRSWLFPPARKLWTRRELDHVGCVAMFLCANGSRSEFESQFLSTVWIWGTRRVVPLACFLSFCSRC